MRALRSEAELPLTATLPKTSWQWFATIVSAPSSATSCVCLFRTLGLAAYWLRQRSVKFPVSDERRQALLARDVVDERYGSTVQGAAK